MPSSGGVMQRKGSKPRQELASQRSRVAAIGERGTEQRRRKGSKERITSDMEGNKKRKTNHVGNK